jgi:PPK2 family polyphosphate:nucleotide phosphotransferase
MAKAAAKNRIDIGRFRVPEGGKGFRLKTIDPGGKDGLPDRAAAEAGMAADAQRIDELQDIMYAQGRHALLCVFQAMDCGGKDGTVRKVFGEVDPIGIVATAFKKPSERELAQDYLWRVHQAVPPRGVIGIFNRSHYEDVLVVRVHGLAPAAAIEQRYGQINAFEKHLSENGVTILKFFLHISKEEQKERLQERIDDPKKRWKFNPADLDERALWPQYMEAYEIALTRCSTRWAPWYVIPADRNWYRNAVVARIVRKTLEGLDLTYPAPGVDFSKIVIR